MKKVVVSLSSDSNAMRECIIGIFNFVNAGHNWDVRIVPDPRGITPGGLTPETVKEAIRSGVNGVLTGVDILTPGFQALVTSGIPLVLNNAPVEWSPDPRAPIIMLNNDNIAVGRLGAQHLMSRGRFRTYAYVPSARKSPWSTYRERGFRLELAKTGIIPVSFDRRRTGLEDWIVALAKPAAIMTVTDDEAVNVIDACHRSKIKVPEQVAVLGVDNDEIFCKSAKPQISSIQPNHIELGRRAALELDRLMRSLRPKRETIFIPPLRVVERRSTMSIPPAGHLIDEGLKFIRNHFQEGIAVKDVAEHLGISESLLRLRFRTVHGKSVRDVLLDTMLEQAKKSLARTAKTIAEVSAASGFSSPCRMSHFFKERLGMSPRDWRLQATGMREPS